MQQQRTHFLSHLRQIFYNSSYSSETLNAHYLFFTTASNALTFEYLPNQIY